MDLASRWAAFSRSHLRTLASAGIGAGLGAAYALTIGCSTGSCPLTSNAWTAALFAGFTGAIAGWPDRPRRVAGAEREAPPVP